MEGLNFARMYKKALVYPIAGYFRKLLLISTLCFMQSSPLKSIQLSICSAQAMMIVVGEFPPFTDKTQNKMELINEFFVVFTNYHLFMFTDFLFDVN